MNFYLIEAISLFRSWMAKHCVWEAFLLWKMKLKIYFIVKIYQKALLYFSWYMITILSKLNLQNSLIQMLIVLFNMIKTSFNLKNQILTVDFMQSFEYMIKIKHVLKINKSIVNTYQFAWKVFHLCCLKAFE